VIARRVPDLRFLPDHLLAGGGDIELDATKIGLVGHSFGGWPVLATTEVERGCAPWWRWYRVAVRIRGRASCR
jgi:hypothetical protein